MTLQELSPQYRAAARAISERIAQLQRQRRESDDPEEAEHLKRRILDLRPLLHQTRQLAELTQRYYERGYHRNEQFTL